jgi:hypothetical protein
MKTAEDSFIRRAAGAIIAIVSLVIISLMLSGGCGGDGGSGGSTDPSPGQSPNPSASPTPPSPPASDAPPLCEDKISLSCPAADLKRATCISDRCEIIDNSVEPSVVIETFFINFSESCTDVDCFTFECENIPIDGVLESPTFIIESLNDYPVGEDIAGPFEFGFPKGTISLSSGDFAFSCGIIAVP